MHSRWERPLNAFSASTNCSPKSDAAAKRTSTNRRRRILAGNLFKNVESFVIGNCAKIDLFIRGNGDEHALFFLQPLPEYTNMMIAGLKRIIEDGGGIDQHCVDENFAGARSC